MFLRDVECNKYTLDQNQLKKMWCLKESVKGIKVTLKILKSAINVF